MFSLIRHWLNTCSKSPDHQLCRQQSDQEKAYPTRLIDVEPPGLPSNFWRLIEVQNESITGHFMTLSHRWGSGNIKLERMTQQKLLDGMHLSILPGTYQDAINVVKHLNVRYLWIDSICSYFPCTSIVTIYLIDSQGIFQDERTDIQKEATRMAEVYGNAICNISALSGKDDGLFCARSPKTMNHDSVTLNQTAFQLNTSYLINDFQLWRGELIHMPLTTRGWVLQEEILAPRTIYFGARQVLWNCVSSRACETYPAMQKKPSADAEVPHHDKEIFLRDEELQPITSWLSLVKTQSEQKRIRGLDRTELDPERLYRVWTDFVSHYSLRQLTFPVDKLLAIAGVSKLFGTIMRDEFIAGLWRNHLMEGLLWSIRANTKTANPSEYRAPTWSWASKDGYVMYAEPFKSCWIVARALDVQCNVAANDPNAPPQEFGLVTSGKMTLKAPVIPLKLEGNGSWTVPTGKDQIPRLIVRLDSTETIAAEEDYIGAIIRTTAYHLTDAPSDNPRRALLAAQGIILKSTHELAKDQGTCGDPIWSWIRIGYFALEDKKSGKLRPRWAPGTGGARIFPSPVKIGGDVEEFDFESSTSAMSVVEIL